MMQALLPGAAVIVALGVFQGMFRYERQKLIRQNQRRSEEVSFEKLFAMVKEELYEKTKKYLEYKEHSEEYERAKNRCNHLQLALKQCGYGYRADKIYVIEIIKDIIMHRLPNREAIYDILPYYDEERLALEDMFDVLLYWYEQSYQEKAL